LNKKLFVLTFVVEKEEKKNLEDRLMTCLVVVVVSKASYKKNKNIFLQKILKLENIRVGT
jgi:hypothetical protein